MKRILFGLAVLSLAACNNADKKQESATGTLPAAATSTNQPQANLLTNPEHGQPGHDCALPVGAPLKQNVNTTTPPPAAATINATSPAQPAVQVEAPKAVSGQKTNPAHGEPGHDCAIPVGAPLK